MKIPQAKDAAKMKQNKVKPIERWHVKVGMDREESRGGGQVWGMARLHPEKNCKICNAKPGAKAELDSIALGWPTLFHFPIPILGHRPIFQTEGRIN